ncbi:MAG: thymidine phosphorylase [Clostridia bacterium]|nr:thymidine phosphorylase [Clostridia bacterium]
MNIYDIISRKRDGFALTEEELRFVARCAARGKSDGGDAAENGADDSQLSALLMAIYLNGMTDEETALLTDAMAHSGDMLDLSRFGTLSADKHSTGGVGDKTSLIVAPICASLGVKMAKMSGRGLGHTGGTVDKLESIPGCRTALSEEEFLSQVERVGVAVVGQTADLAPADKKLYSLRDHTATVGCIPLIVSSIMSKKLAAGAKNIVLDVKYGSGAFMKTPEKAEELATKMVNIGKACGRNVAAVLTDMDTPLGTNIGNSLEVMEAADVLKYNVASDLSEVSFTLAAHIVSLTYGMPFDDAMAHVKDTVSSGAAFAKMKEWIAAQGGDASCLEDPSRFPQAAAAADVISDKGGFLAHMDAEAVGLASVALGAGRTVKDGPVDHAAGIVLRKKTGDRVVPGDVLCTLYTNKTEAVAQASERFLSALTFAEEPPVPQPLILKSIN